MITNEYGMEKRQKELLRLIKDVDYIFNKAKIKYSLCGGTLLGAIRHNGFIPWDDDLDIMVDRQNQEKILRLFKRHNGVLKVRDKEDPRGYAEYSIVRRLWVYQICKNESTRKPEESPVFTDIMVMDNCPDNDIERRIKVFSIQTLQGMMHKSLELDGFSLPHKICLLGTYILGKPFSDRLKFKMYEAASQIGNKNKTQYTTGYNDLFKLLKIRYPGKLLENIELHQFEDTMLPVTSEYDSYLTLQYGDYMTPPPKEERVPIHTQTQAE